MPKETNKRKSDPDNGSTRRSFLSRIWVGLGLVAVAELVWLAFSFMRPRKPKVMPGDFGAVIDCGPLKGFQKNSVTAFPRGRFYLCRLQDGGFLALSRQCTHLGCTVPWDEEVKIFRCPCHASTFDINGAVVSTPAPRALDLYFLAIENERVKVDTGRLIKRGGFHPSQVVYPKAEQ